jgi:hypothetical protein
MNKRVKLPYGCMALNVYFVDRCYGGPEEGGWYYDAGQVERTILVRKGVSLDRARDRVQRVVDAWNEGCAPLHSVLSTGRYALRVQDTLGKDYPEERPYYC